VAAFGRDNIYKIQKSKFGMIMRNSSLFVFALLCASTDVSFGFLTVSSGSGRALSSMKAKQLQNRPHVGGTALFVVADPPNKEEEELERHGKKDDDDNNNNSNNASWIPTKDGGFIPKLPLRHRQGGKKAVQEVLTIQEYKAVVAEEKDQMVCVRFYAPWCKACKAIEERFRAFPRKYPSVKFVEMPFTKDNAYLHEGLGIPVFPFAHLYHPEAGLVEERRIKRKVFKDFEKILKTYVEGGCKVEYDDENDGMAVSP